MINIDYYLIDREEWEWLHNNNNNNECSTEESLDLFKSQFRNAAKELFVMLGKIFLLKAKIRLYLINLDLPEAHFSNSRIYDSQVVEIRDDLSLIILMSTADEVNILSTPSYHSFNSFIYLPVYIFEVCKLYSISYHLK
jgi:hypothetical protein